VDSRRAYLVLAVACSAYIVAILQRTSLGVAGVLATERFHIDATSLSALAVVQLVVYALLQIPVGVLVDRFGSRSLIALGAVFMATGQLALAFAPEFWMAVTGRALVGAGDAMTFVSVLRLLGHWFSPRRLPQLSQWVATLGQSGQLLSAIPFAILLQLSGWTVAFSVVAAVSVLAVCAVLAAVRDAPDGAPSARAMSIGESLARLRASVRHPGTLLGFWSHAALQSSGTTLLLLWGFPFFSIGLGYGPAGAAALLALVVATGALMGPIIGLLSARYPFRRSNLVLLIVGAMGASWAALLLWPSIPPLPAVIVMLVCVAIGGPGSLIGFDFARTFNPPDRHGSATGFVNTGGFMLAVMLMLVVGVLLDVQSPSAAPTELYAWEHWRWAFAAQFPIVGAAVVALVLTRRSTRRRLMTDDGVTVAPLWIAIVRRWRRRR